MCLGLSNDDGTDSSGGVRHGFVDFHSSSLWEEETKAYCDRRAIYDRGLPVGLQSEGIQEKSKRSLSNRLLGWTYWQPATTVKPVDRPLTCVSATKRIGRKGQYAQTIRTRSSFESVGTRADSGSGGAPPSTVRTIR